MLNSGFVGRLAGRFARNNKGSVATLSALALIPVTIAAGAGLDISRAMMGRGALQDALDATALALAHMPANTPNATLKERGQQWLTANLTNSGLGAVTLVVTPAKGKIVLDASADVPTVISSLAGISNVPVKAHSEVKWGLNHVELALVLDNTGSMAGTKLSTLKTAANALIDTLVNSTDTSDPDALKISVVPFSMTVKIGSGSALTTYQSASWMKGALPYRDANNQKAPDIFTANNTNRFTMFKDLGASWGGCVEARPAPYDVQDTAPTSTIKNTYFVPYFAPDEPDDDRVKRNSWSYYDFPNNYISDDVNGNNFTDAGSGQNWKVPQGQKSKYAKYDPTKDGPNNGCTGLQSLLRLTPASQVSTIKAKISAMTASGNTNVPFGMMWGWHTLSPNAPFADGVAYDDANTKKIMVVLTDGDNVMSNNDTPNHGTYSGMGYIWQKRLEGADENSNDSQRTAAMDARMTLLCQNAKAAGKNITIYTVRVDMPGTSSPTALKNCASDPTMFYDVPDVSNLSTAFDAIAGSIGKLRISE
jgi:Flp pilus assembly protein TadG